MLTALHGGGASACTITQLEKNTLYDFFLIPFYKSIEGKPSNLKQATTLNSISAWFTTFEYGSRAAKYLSRLLEMAATRDH